MTAREAAFRSLVRIEKEGRYSNLETDVTLRGGLTDENEARLYTRLVYGTIERKLTLDYILTPMIKGMSYEKTDLEVRMILRMSAYQILFADRIPESAAVNEGVNLAKKYIRSAAPMVNAILRRLCREKSGIAYPDREKDPIGFLSAFYSVSPEICRLFYDDLGMEECSKMLEAMNNADGVTLRVNTLRISVPEFVSRLSARGISAKRCAYAPYGVKVGSIAGLPELREGLCFVQDEASQLAVEALDVHPGMTVIDTCACPGGKSFGAAMNMQNSGTLYSCDLHKNKLSLVEEGADTLGIGILSAMEADGRIFREEFEGKADRLICDLPCSGLGVLSKKPDLRYKREEEMARLPEIQWAILENVCRYLKPGGRLVFSTCTVLNRENGELYARFVSEHPEFEPVPLCLPGDLPQDVSFVTLYPHVHHTDGFFISALRKK